MVDVEKMLADLRSEHQALNELIVAMELYQSRAGKRRRGRRPAWLADVTPSKATSNKTRQKQSPAELKDY